MNTTIRTTVSLLILAALGSGAHAQSTASAMTRAQVQAELRDAIRRGDMPAPGDTGLTLRELDPQRYPAVPATAIRTRADVQTELAQARASGALYASGEGVETLNQQNPGRYAAAPVEPGKTRVQVRAETREAIRTGEMLAGGESGLKLNELNPAHYRHLAPPVVAEAGLPLQAAFVGTPVSTR